MVSIDSYVRRGKHTLRRWMVDPRVHTFMRGSGYFAAGFALSAASLGQGFLPLPLALVCGCSGLPALLSSLGGLLGYRVFWGIQQQPVLWLKALW